MLCLQILIAVMHTEEMSARVLYLTEELLTINPAHYTAWQYRRKCLVHLNESLEAELRFMDEFCGDNPKNYQIWYHRRSLVCLIGEASVQGELEFTERVFEGDSKNYHAWAHRQFLVRRFNRWDGELALVDSCLEADVRNNSAWNHVREHTFAITQLVNMYLHACVLVAAMACAVRSIRAPRGRGPDSNSKRDRVRVSQGVPREEQRERVGIHARHSQRLSCRLPLS